jgi:hypothetical protein
MSERFWTPEQFAAYLRNFKRAPQNFTIQAPITSKPQKYRAQPKIVDSIRFSSTKEADRYSELKLLRQAGVIRDLELQPVFPLSVNGRVIGSYVGDFRYYSIESGRIVVEDVKGMKSLPLYRWKIKHLRAEHGIEVVEIR